jgi:signal peptidase I
MKKLTRSGWGKLSAYLLSFFLLATALANILGLISLRIVQTDSMQGTINPGDLVVSQNWLKPSVGDIAIYHEHALTGGSTQDVVHRVIAGDAENGYTFQGDNNLSADPLSVNKSDVVGVVNFWVPGPGKLASPLILLLFVALIAFVYFAREYIKSGSRKATQWVASRGRVLRALVRTALTLISIWLILTGLALAGFAKFEHPQVGPQLAIGSSNQSVVLVAPHTAAKVGDLALAQIAGRRNLVRIEAVKGHVYTVSSNMGKILIPSADLEGPIRLVLPFIGVLWLPFD